MTSGVSRRAFLSRSTKTVIAGLAIPAIVPAIALGRQGPAPSDRILTGHIGCGGQGSGLIKGFKTTVAAVCDVDSTRLAAAAKLAQEQSGREPLTYSDFRRVLENDDISAVVVATPDHWHALITAMACEAGKDVYCEKPLVHTISEGRAVVNIARRTGRIVQTGSQQRSDAKFRTGCEYVRSGRIGKVHTVRVGLPGVNMNGDPVPDSDPPPELDYDMWLGTAPDRPYNVRRVHYFFRFFWDYAGGQMTNFGAHHLDIAQWGLGTDGTGPVSVEGNAGFHPTGLYETPQWAELKYTYADGAVLLCTLGKGDPAGTVFEGGKGTMHLERGVLQSDPPSILEEPLGDGDVHLYKSDDHIGNFLDCVKTRKEPICGPEIGQRSSTIGHLGNIVARTGHPLKWDPETESVIGDEEQAALTRRTYRAPWSLPTE